MQRVHGEQHVHAGDGACGLQLAPHAAGKLVPRGVIEVVQDDFVGVDEKQKRHGQYHRNQYGEQDSMQNGSVH